MYWLYSALFAVLLIITLPYWLLQRARHGKYRAGMSERMGKVPNRINGGTSSSLVWVHAVSVGEVLAVTGLINKLHAQYPNLRIVISTTTDTGQRLARTQFGEENVFYFPLDFAFAIRPYLEQLHPSLIIIAETELWPNFLRLARASGARIAIVNARISDKSWRGYRRFRFLLQRVLRNVELIVAQTEQDRQRLVALGAGESIIRVAGNLKFDLSLPAAPPIVASLRNAFAVAAATPVLVCGSTVEGEEPMLLQGFVNVLASYPRAVMILAPRHPERFAEVTTLVEQLGMRFWRRSLWSGEPISGGVFLLDSIGELAALYGLADIAFVGGSLVPKGGHNIIEPARHGVPIMVGNHTENFRDIVSLFQGRDAVRVVGPAEFPLVLMDLISKSDEREALGRRAAETLQSQTGATDRTLHALAPLLNAAEAHELTSSR